MANKTLEDFNREYLAVHVRKEDLFWTTYMGVENHPEEFEKAEQAFKNYISDPARFEEIRAALDGFQGDEKTRFALNGWLKFFEANAIESEAGRKLQAELIALEGALFQKRAKLQLTFRTSTGEEKPGSTNVMASNIAASPDETVRKTSHEALLKLEQWVLANGYLELVKKRNEFARALGHRNYFDYRVRKLERLTQDQLFKILDEFERLTRDKCMRQLEVLKKEKGPQAVLGHNLRYAIAGDVQNKADPYFPFAKSLEVWSRNFAHLGIGYRGAKLTLDLLDRKGKYENGFMHGPQPCYFDRGNWQPARINFTSNAVPNQVGSGLRALGTLFHEGGHAAHFSNITQDAPCFSQEYPPTSMAFAETQSMFCDSLINDADWLSLYARDRQGNPMPEELIRLLVTSDQPFQAYNERSILVVPVFESQLYSLPDHELTPERATALARECEKRILGVDCSPRPIMAIPHLLSGDGSCSYQGYLLAHMAVYQTRAHFLQAHGYLSDNPEIGPALARHYWNPGNSISHAEVVRSLTGRDFSGQALADRCNEDVEALWEKSKKQIQRAQERANGRMDEIPSLNAEIRIVHGAQEIANNGKSMMQLWSDFEAWINRA